MPYVENRTVHDADAHVMELPNTIVDYFEDRYQDEFVARTGRDGPEPEWVDEIQALHDDPEFRAGDEENLMLRKNAQALGSFRSTDRPKALDLLGFTSQLVFTSTALGMYGLEENRDDHALAIATARAHNRMMADFCSVDGRLLPTGYVPLLDIEQAPQIAREAIELGCKGLVIPSRVPNSHSPSHVGFDPLWALVQEAGLPILFHVGGEQKMDQAYFETGLPAVLDFHGGAENFTSTSFMSIPISVWQTMAVLIIDGVLDRFQNLKFGAIELGASWVPSWLRFMDAAHAAFYKNEERLHNLSAPPSEIVRRQFRVTPYSHEDTGWIIENSGPEVCLFSSDWPHVEGGRNPLKRFAASVADLAPAAQQRFYRDNFVDLMGDGLDPGLRDHPNISLSRELS